MTDISEGLEKGGSHLRTILIAAALFSLLGIAQAQSARTDLLVTVAYEDPRGATVRDKVEEAVKASPKLNLLGGIAGPYMALRIQVIPSGQDSVTIASAWTSYQHRTEEFLEMRVANCTTATIPECAKGVVRFTEQFASRLPSRR